MKYSKETGFDVSKAAKNLKKRHDQENDLLEKRRTQAKNKALEAVKQMAAADNSLIKVIGFGSTFETWRNYNCNSDIDLAIEGGNMKILEKALPTSDFEFSIIELKDQAQAFKQLVLKNGEILYEK